MITSRELEGHTSLAEGQQININHIDCPAGADRKKRLYIKRISSGWLCYCQHCQDKGFIRDDSVKRVGSLETFTADSATVTGWAKYDLPKTVDLEWDITKWPTEPKLWLLSYGLKDISTFAWEEKRKLLWLNNDTLNTSNIQARNFSPVVKAKYITIKAGKHNNDQWTVGEQPTIIVEDYVSAKKVREAGYGARCLFGTKFDYTYPVPISNPLIWLDDDTAGFLAAAEMSTKNGWSIIKHKQPKECSHEEIKHLVEEHSGRIYPCSI